METQDNTPGWACDSAGCNFISSTERGLKMHKSQMHRLISTPSEVFDRIGKATEALFPEGVPASRIIEIAELQKQMLKVVSR